MNPPQHRLTWAPGQPGKGFILDDGGVWAWNTENMRPRHMDMSYRVKQQGLRVRPGTAFHIEPEGRVWQYGEGRTLSPDDAFAIQKANAGLWLGDPKPPGEVEAPYGHAESLMRPPTTFSHLKTAQMAPGEELMQFLKDPNAGGSFTGHPNNPMGQNMTPSANPANPSTNPDLPGSYRNPSNLNLNPNVPGSLTNPSNLEFNPELPGSIMNPTTPQRNPAYPGSMTNPSNPMANPAYPGSYTNPSNPMNNPAFPTPSDVPRPEGVSENASTPPNRLGAWISDGIISSDEAQDRSQQDRRSYRQALAQGSQGDDQAQVEPYFPTLEDAIDANREILAQSGQSNHAVLRPQVLEGALARPQQYWHYTQSLPDAAGALAHGVGQAQAFEDGNKRTAYWLTHYFLHENGLGHLMPSDDEELADHLIGYGEGTHQLEDTQQMFHHRQGRMSSVWQPGTWGRGLEDETGNFHTWQTTDLSSRGTPHHREYAEEQGINAWHNPIIINPYGHYTQNGEIDERVREYPRYVQGLKYVPDFDKWMNRSSATKQADWGQMDTILDYNPGRHPYRDFYTGQRGQEVGRGILTPEGKLWTWPEHEMSHWQRMHSMGYSLNDESQMPAQFLINPQGAVRFTAPGWYHGRMDEDALTQHVVQRDPRLIPRSESTGPVLRQRLTSWTDVPFDERTGQEPHENDIAPERTPEGHLVFYHGTSPQGAQNIMAERHLRPDDLNVVGLSTTPGHAQSYSAMKKGPVLRVTVDPADLQAHSVSREVGGSGRNQFLVSPKDWGRWPVGQWGTKWDGLPIQDAQVHDFERQASVKQGAAFNALDNVLHYNPGRHPYKNIWTGARQQEHGRGLLTPEGALITWPESEATHWQRIHDMGYPMQESEMPAQYIISPEGRVSVTAPGWYHDKWEDSWAELEQAAVKRDPRLVGYSDWERSTFASYKEGAWEPPSARLQMRRALWPEDRFGPMPQDRPGTLNWEPGSTGKGAIIRGVPHTWNTENLGGSPHHVQYLRTLAEDKDQYNSSDWITIGPEGHYTPDGYHRENPVDPSMFARVQRGLKYVPDPTRWRQKIDNPQTPANWNWIREADNWQSDTRNWPDPTEPRAGKPPKDPGCTCDEGHKLDCPIHGLWAHAEDLEDDKLWNLPEGSPVSYPQDAPRSWQQALGSAAPQPPNYRKADSKDRCGTCKMFDKGLCWGYGNTRVEEDAVCDSFAPEGKLLTSKVSVSTIPLDQIAYIAEGALERGGLVGRQWHVPQNEVKQYREGPPPRLHPIEQQMTTFAQQVTGLEYARVFASNWIGGGDTTSGSADPITGYVTVRFDTNDLVILHECAHLMAGSNGRGHTPQWFQIAHDLYTRYLGAEAGQNFWNLVSPYLEPETKVSANDSPQVVYHDDIEPNPIGGAPEGYWGRWPVIYDEKSHTLHIGPEGTTHMQVAEKVGGGLIGLPARYEGWRGHNPKDEVEVGPNPEVRHVGGQEYGWYNGSPGPAVNWAMVTFNYPPHPDSDQSEEGGYGHAYRFTGYYDRQYACPNCGHELVSAGARGFTPVNAWGPKQYSWQCPNCHVNFKPVETRPMLKEHA